MRPIRLLSCALLFVAVAAPVWAQTDPDIGGGSADPEFEGNAGAVIINGLRIIKRQDLDFGIIAPSLTQPGTVRVNRGRNNDSECSVELTCLQEGNRARYTVIGEPLRYYNISDPGQIWVEDNANNRMLVDTFFGAGSGNNSTWRGWQRLRSSGLTRFNVGAILHVNPNQPRGAYAGTFIITVEYQ